MKKEPKANFLDVVRRMRKRADSAPSWNEISREVEMVRKGRYEKQ